MIKIIAKAPFTSEELRVLKAVGSIHDAKTIAAPEHKHTGKLDCQCLDCIEARRKFPKATAYMTKKNIPTAEKALAAPNQPIIKDELKVVESELHKRAKQQGKIRKSMAATLTALYNYGEPVSTADLSQLMDKTVASVAAALTRLKKEGMVSNSANADGFVGKPPNKWNITKYGNVYMEVWLHE